MVVEIMFSGLIAFVRGSCEVKNAKTIEMVMVKGKMDKHFPKLVVNVKDVHFSEGDLPPDEIVQVFGGNQLAIWNLKNKEIEVMNAPDIQIVEGHRTAGQNGKEYRNSYPSEYKPPDPPSDFSWLPELHVACNLKKNKPMDRRAKKDVLKPGKLGGFGVARFAALKVLPTADPKTNFLQAVLDQPLETDVYAFPDQANGYEQVVADRARLEMTFVANPVELRIHRAGWESFKTIHLGRSPRDTISISISNLPRGIPKADADPSLMAHFHEYYKLLDYDSSDACPTPKSKYSKDKKELSKESKDDGPRAVQPIKCALCSTCGPD